MIRNLQRISIALAIAVRLAAGAFAESADSQYPAQPGPEITAGERTGGFLDLFRILAAQGSVRTKFTEYRWFPFRTAPVVLRGEMRFSRELGLSLHYTSPQESIVIADAGGLILRDASGRSREIHPDERMPDLGGSLAPVLRFDDKELFEGFHVRGARLGNAWRIDFTPKAAELARMIGTIIVEGKDSTLSRIEFHRSSTQRIEIQIESSETGVTFGTDERKRYFR
jgi:outer membrane lipoprotein-sorting protein